MKRITILLLFIITLGSQAQELLPGVSSITETSCRAQVEFLSNDLLLGRGAGTQENRIAALYLVSQLCELGYKPEIQRFEGKNGLPLQNILVRIPGRDTTKMSIIGAHYDHLGIRNGQIYNGADDNASGTVAILQIAHAIQAQGVQPKRTIILALWDGEESGLQGSKFFVTSLAKDSARVVNYMNFDMIGRNTDESQPEMFRYFYNDNRPNYRKWLDGAIVEYKLQLKPDYKPWDKPTSGSDNASFAKVGIPIVWYHTDGHPDYHQPSDTPDKINYPKMVDIIKSAYVVAWKINQE